MSSGIFLNSKKKKKKQNKFVFSVTIKDTAVIVCFCNYYNNMINVFFLYYIMKNI